MEAAVGAAIGLVSSVVKQLSDELVQAYVASSQLGLNADKIKNDLMHTQGLLHEAQRRDMTVADNPGLQDLLHKLGTTADQAEDALDELHYFIIQDQLDGTHYAVPDLGDGTRGRARHGCHDLRHTVGNCLKCFSCSRTPDDDHDANNPHSDIPMLQALCLKINVLDPFYALPSVCLGNIQSMSLSTFRLLLAQFCFTSWQHDIQAKQLQPTVTSAVGIQDLVAPSKQ